MSRPYLLHGRRHKATGSDPIFDGDPILFNTDNEGGWLWIVANEAGESTYGEEAIVIQDTTSEGIAISSPDGDIALNGGGSYLLLTSSYIQLYSPGDIEIPLSVGGTMRVRDSDGNPIFEVRDDGTVHIPTGGSIVADL